MNESVLYHPNLEDRRLSGRRRIIEYNNLIEFMEKIRQMVFDIQDNDLEIDPEQFYFDWEVYGDALQMTLRPNNYAREISYYLGYLTEL